MVNFCSRSRSGSQVDPGVQARVRDPAGGHAERAAFDVDVPLQVRIFAGAHDVNIGLERSGHIGDLRRECLDDSEIQGGCRHLQVDPVTLASRAT